MDCLGCCVDKGLTVTCSIFTLTALSIDHYLTVKAPTRRSQQLDSGQRGAIIILIVIWVVSALLVGPILHVRRVHIVDLSIDQVSICSRLVNSNRVGAEMGINRFQIVQGLK